MSLKWISKPPAYIEGDRIIENAKLKEHLRWCLDIIENFPISASHEGPCSPPATPCDGSCMDAYYVNRELDIIRKAID